MENQDFVPLLRLVDFTEDELDCLSGFVCNKVLHSISKFPSSQTLQKPQTEYTKGESTKNRFKSIEKPTIVPEQDILNVEHNDSLILKEADGFYKCLRPFINHDFDFIEVENCLLLGEFKIPRNERKCKNTIQLNNDEEFDISDDLFNQSSDKVLKNPNNITNQVLDLQEQSIQNLPIETDFVMKFLFEFEDKDVFENFNSSQSNSLTTKRPIGPDSLIEGDNKKALKKIHPNVKPSSSLNSISLN
jgi:hypothetical protein